MCSLRRPSVLGGVTAVLAIILLVAQPRPSLAGADVGGAAVCGAASGGVGVIGGIAEDVTGGAIGGGNPLGDLCGKVAGKVTGAITGPVTDALKGVGDDIFKEMTRWVSQGAGWLMGQVVEVVDSSTTPHLRRAGFLSEYTKMAGIAVLLAVAALVAAIFQGIAQGNPGLMVRAVLVNTPLAFLGTSIAFVVVQLLIGATDSLCHAVTAGTGNHGSQLFEAAIGDLGKVGGDIGEAGAGGGIGAAQGHDAGQVAVPLFVGFLLAIVGAFAALAVLLELLMRDAGIYAVSLFMPFALYASISPRWRGVMRRYAEGLFALIESKFIIVAIMTLAGTLVAKEDTSVEVVLVASTLMALSCFAPFLLFRLVAIAGHAGASSVGRRAAGGAALGGASRALHTARSIQGMAGSGSNDGGSGVKLWSASEMGRAQPSRPATAGAGAGGGAAGGRAGGGTGGPSGDGGGGEGPPRPGGSGASAGPSKGHGKAAAGRGPGAAGAAATAGGAAAAAGSAAAKTPQKGVDRISETGVAKSVGGGDAGEAGEQAASKGHGEGAVRGHDGTPPAGRSTERGPRPTGTPEDPDAGGSSGAPGPDPPADRAPRPSPSPPERPDGDDAGATS